MVFPRGYIVLRGCTIFAWLYTSLAWLFSSFAFYTVFRGYMTFPWL